MPDEIVILGAGPAGMACAMELHRAGKNFRLIEKSAQVGGLAKTYQFGKFRTDNGPHRFFSQNQYLYEFIEDLLHEKWIKVNRHTRFYIDGKFYHYPVELKSALLTMGLFQAFRAVLDYGMEKIKPRREPENFEEYVVSKFGQTLAEFNMLNYTEKIWGLPCSQLSAEWARQRIKDLSVTALLKNALFKKRAQNTRRPVLLP
ncbi:MAG: NAD(P)-binding protein [Candidatus Diapherotrites archaeon]|nr:NAD(P)-binding protein [Candidatus Diapherotrites archaeon]